MPSRAPLAILRGDLREHPAVRAWRALGPACLQPESVEILRERRQTSIYRLTGVGDGRSAVVAKRSCAAGAAVERTVYEQILPRLPVSAPRYYGSLEEEGELRWLFVEDVGRERYSDVDPGQRSLAGRWLARMHGLASRAFRASGPPPGLPDGGPARYLEHLRSARGRILRTLCGPALRPDDVAGLKSLLRDLDALEAKWGRLTPACEGAQPTLVHGDFRPKNVYVRRHSEQVELLPIDWETAGWGPPAVDLTRADLDAYVAAFPDGGAELGPRHLRELEQAGQVFRHLAAIGWETVGLAFDAPEFLVRPLASLRVLRARLADAVRAVRLGG